MAAAHRASPFGRLGRIMRFKLFAVTALAGTMIVSMTVGPATAAPRPVGDKAPVAAALSPTEQIGVLGELGAVTQSVGKLVDLAAPAQGAPDVDAVKKQREELQKTADALLESTGGGSGTLAADAHGPRALSIKDAVSKILKDADALVKLVTSGNLDANAMADAVKTLATDLLALHTAVATALGGGALPTKSNP